MATTSRRKPAQRVERCPWCEKPFNGSEAVTANPERHAVYSKRPGYGGTLTGYADVKRNWHTACLEAFDASNRKLRRESFIDSFATFIEMGTITLAKVEAMADEKGLLL